RDAVAGDVEGHDRDDSSAHDRGDAGAAVDEDPCGVFGQASGQDGLVSDGLCTGDDLSRGAMICVQNRAVVQERQQGCEVAVLGGGEPGVDDTTALSASRASLLLGAPESSSCP